MFFRFKYTLNKGSRDNSDHNQPQYVYKIGTNNPSKRGVRIKPSKILGWSGKTDVKGIPGRGIADIKARKGETPGSFRKAQISEHSWVKTAGDTQDHKSHLIVCKKIQGHLRDAETKRR